MFLKDGHYKYVEKHFTGITFGIGENGHLWVLSSNSKRMDLSGFKGNHLQVDEMDMVFWEKQRYNNQSFEWNDVLNENVIKKWLFFAFSNGNFFKLP